MRIFKASILKMRYLKLSILILTIVNLSMLAYADEVLRLTPGFIYKLKCEGRLLISAVGDESLLRIEALPKDVGCGSVLKALRASGTSNLILETSTGTISRIIEVSERFGKPSSAEIFLISDRGTSK